jgi:phosphatidylserine decarboxylase
MNERIPDVSPDLPPLKWRALLRILRRLPQGALSRAFGAVTDIPLPRSIRPLALRTFAGILGIDASEAARPESRTAGSPVEAVTGQFGRISDGTLIQAKGRTYSLARLLGDDAEAARYEGGSFLTLYLSPRHYHRIHAPTAGSIAKARHVPGHLLPVNAPSVMHVPELFAVNERLICYVDGELGRIAVVAVGAYNVGRISAAFDAQWSKRGWVTNRSGVRAETRSYTPAISVTQGEEIMAFHLGSTVIMILEPAAELDASLQTGAEIRLGQAVAHIRQERH